MDDEIPEFEPVHAAPQFDEESLQAFVAATKRSVEAIENLRDSLARMSPLIINMIAVHRRAMTDLIPQARQRHGEE